MSVKIEAANAPIAAQTVSDPEGGVWSVAALIEEAKGLPILDIPLEYLYMDYTLEGLPMRRFIAHMRSTLQSDLSYPIILDENGSLFDGHHRLAKALLERRDTIRAVRFKKDPTPLPREKK